MCWRVGLPGASGQAYRGAGGRSRKPQQAQLRERPVLHGGHAGGGGDLAGAPRPRDPAEMATRQSLCRCADLNALALPHPKFNRSIGANDPTNGISIWDLVAST